MTVINWLRIKQTTIIHALATLLGALAVIGQQTGWFIVTPELISATLTAVGTLWLVIGAQSVTSNKRLVGKHLSSTSGVTVGDVAEANGLVRAHTAAAAAESVVEDPQPNAPLVDVDANVPDLHEALVDAGLA